MMRFLCLLLLTSICAASSLSAQKARSPIRADDPLSANIPNAYTSMMRSEGAVRAFIWTDARADGVTPRDVFLCISKDYGVTWGSSIQITNAGALEYMTDPNAEIVNGTIHISFSTAGAPITYRRYDDDGNMLSSMNLLIPHSISNHKLVVDGSYAAIMYATPHPQSSNEVYVVWSTDGGVSWTNALSPIPFDPNNNGGQYDVRAYEIAVEQTGPGVWQLHAFSYDNRNGTRDLWYRRIDNGGSFGSLIRIDQGPSGTGDVFASNIDLPQINVFGDRLHVAWLEFNRNNAGNQMGDFFYRRSLDGGNTWEPEQHVGNYVSGTDDVNAVALGVDDDVVALTWADDRSGSPSAYVSVSSDTGQSFGPEHAIPGGGISTTDVDRIAAQVWGNTIVIGYRDSSFANTHTEEQPVFVVSSDAGANWTTPLQPGLFSLNEDTDLGMRSWFFEHGSLSVMWSTNFASGGQPAGTFVGGMRLPWITSAVDFGQRTIQMSLGGADMDYSGEMARWAASTSLGSVVHPENSALLLELAPSSIYTKTLAPAIANQLTATIQNDGTAQTAVLPVPVQASGLSVHFQGWVNQRGVGLPASDVIDVRLP